VFQWHGDTFSTLPPGAVPLAESEACKNQAFVIGRSIWGFQFHWEMTGDIIADLALNCADELSPGPWVQSAEELTGHPELVRENNERMEKFLNCLEKGPLQN
jgi:hypothetical protein